jgi:hypothetical protein
VTALLSSITDPQVDVNVQVCDPEWLPPVRETARVPLVGRQQLVSRVMLVPVMVAVPPALSVTFSMPLSVYDWFASEIDENVRVPVKVRSLVIVPPLANRCTSPLVIMLTVAGVWPNEKLIAAVLISLGITTFAPPVPV